ncbi:MAG: hypothetical protein ACFFC0_08085, partial [Promethearchaeota archaeon]
VQGVPRYALIALLCLLLLGPIACSATEVWSDDFNDGNFDGWVGDARTIVVDGTLRGSYSTEVYRQCDLTCGVWSFDILDMGGWELSYEPGLYMYFMSSHPDTPLRTFYCLRVTQGTTATGLKYIYAITKMDGEATVTLASADGIERPDLRGVLHHIKVTRTATGHMSVYVNETLMVEATDSEISTSECFRILLGYDYAIDNIVVDDTPPGIPMELLAVGAGAVAIVVVTLVALRRRR